MHMKNTLLSLTLLPCPSGPRREPGRSAFISAPHVTSPSASLRGWGDNEWGRDGEGGRSFSPHLRARFHSLPSLSSPGSSSRDGTEPHRFTVHYATLRPLLTVAPATRWVTRDAKGAGCEEGGRETITIIVQFFPAVTNDFLFHIPAPWSGVSFGARLTAFSLTLHHTRRSLRATWWRRKRETEGTGEWREPGRAQRWR